METLLLFVALPLALLVLAWRIRPLVGRGDRPGDGHGGGLAGTGMFGGHGLDPDPVAQREETGPLRFELGHASPLLKQGGPKGE